MKRFNWNNIRLLLIIAAIGFLYSFSGGRNEARKLKGVSIEFADKESYITKDKVNKLLIQNYGEVTGISKENLDLNNVEKRLNENPMIDKAEVYATIDGKLIAVIVQRKPVARVFKGGTSFYIDHNGAQMPLSESETARVLLVTGAVESVDAATLHQLVNYIFDDVYLKKNIVGVAITPAGGVKMRCRDHDYEIIFGRPVDIDRKFKNYKAFLQDAKNDTVIDNYKTINLKFTQQVVCTKK
ncbi:cell division protein FtsQ/DivIB [Flavobacterium rhizosphaerae]|uniref:Cell division protein FtsQ n=1 Tax=Flavobacterium rhizosphaerae TaxID=3163298 RepID=A0ABW8Z296_9FLAO